MLDYKLIEALAAVVEQGGFDKAARALHLTQSAVSQRVRLLEDRMGQVLVVRANPPAPTEAGRRVLSHYRQVRRLEEDLGEAVSPGYDPDADPAGTDAERVAVLPLGVNADSVATWLPDALQELAVDGRVLLDVRVDDQDQTHTLLRDGEVLGCVSAREEPMQGCRAEYLGRMDYRLCGSPAYAARWCPDGLDARLAGRVPLLIFNRKDELHRKLFLRAFGAEPDSLRALYYPTAEGFPDAALRGWGAAMLPEQQSAPLLAARRLVDLLPGHRATVRLYWHRWNLRSPLLDRLTGALLAGAREALEA